MWRSVYLALVLVLPLYFVNAPANRWWTTLWAVWVGLVLILYGVRSVARGQKEKWIKWSMVVLLLLVMVQAVFISAAPVLSFWEGLRWLGYLGFGWLSWRYLAVEGNRGWWRLWQTMVASSYLVVLYIVVVEVVWPGRFGQLAKLNGPMGWHNQLAGYLVMIIPLTVVEWWRALRGRWKLKIWWTGWLGVLTAALLLTYSRGAWLASLTVGITVGGVWAASGWRRYGWVKEKLVFGQQRLIWLLSVGLVALGLVYSLTGQPAGKIKQRAETIAAEVNGAGRSVSGRYRVVAWQDSWQMIKDKPLTGWGVGAYRVAYRQYQREPWIAVNFPHNLFLRIGVEIGVLGLGLTVVMAGWLGWLGLDLLRRRPSVRWAGLVGAYLAALGHNMVDLDSSMTGLAGYLILLGVMVGWAVNISRGHKQKVSMTAQPAKIDWGWVGWGVGIVTAGVYLWLGLNLPGKIVKLYRLGQIEAGLSLARQGVRYFPFEYNLWTAIADGSYRLGDKTAALMAGKRAVEVFSNYSEGYYNLAVYRWNNGQRELAVQTIKVGITRSPLLSPLPYLKLASWYGELGMLDRQRAMLAECAFVSFPRNETFYAFEWMIKHTQAVKMRDKCEADWRQVSASDNL